MADSPGFLPSTTKPKRFARLVKAPVPVILASMFLLTMLGSLFVGLHALRHNSSSGWAASDEFCGLVKENIIINDTSHDNITDVTDISANIMLNISSRADQPQALHIRFITLNIRYATKKPVYGEKPWKIRMPKLTNQLNFITVGYNNSFICLQETLHSQLQDIQDSLGAPWSHIGRGRGVSETDGEYSPIFYRSDHWKIRRTTTRWLSKTPEKHSKGWDATRERIATLAEFTHRVTGTRIIVMSTHFDFTGRIARQCSARLLIHWAEEWGGSREGVNASAVLIGGDFNSPPKDGAYKTMMAPESGLSDLSGLVPTQKHYGNYITYTTFGESGQTASRLDYLFLRDDSQTTVVKTFGVLPNQFDDGIRLSDHRPVVSDLDITV